MDGTNGRNWTYSDNHHNHNNRNPVFDAWFVWYFLQLNKFWIKYTGITKWNTERRLILGIAK
jgi:hypothetical protein